MLLFWYRFPWVARDNRYRVHCGGFVACLRLSCNRPSSFRCGSLDFILTLCRYSMIGFIYIYILLRGIGMKQKGKYMISVTFFPLGCLDKNSLTYDLTSDLTFDLTFNLNHLCCLLFVILPLIILFMLSIQDLLNKSELKPDWKVREEDKRRQDELIRRLKKQASEEAFLESRKKNDVYSPLFSADAVLSQELIDCLHSRSTSILWYDLRDTNWATQQRLYPKMINHVGIRNKPVNAPDYLKVAGIRWF